MGCGATFCGISAASAAILAVAVSMYIAWPCPKLSKNLQEWKSSAIGDSAVFNTKNRKIFYKESIGNGSFASQETLILLHGFPTSSYDWFKMWPELTARFQRVIAVDFLGFGFSDKPLNYKYSIVEQADLVIALLRALHIKECHMLSHDYGDSVAQELLARQNEGNLFTHIKSACLLNGGMFKETNFPMPIQRMLASSPVIGSYLSMLTNQKIFNRALSEIFGPKTKPTARDSYDFWCATCYNQGYKNAAALLSYIAERSDNNLRWRKALQESRVPVHVIYGPADPVNPPKPFIEFYKETVPNGTIDVLDDHIGHYPQWEDSENVLRLYISFVESVISHRKV